MLIVIVVLIGFNKEDLNGTDESVVSHSPHLDDDVVSIWIN